MASWHTLLGIWSVFGLWLILRLMDELKDEEIDRELFPARPVPSGRVAPSDIKLTLLGTILIYVGAHLVAPKTLWSALAVLGYASLMFNRFFAAEALRKSLILTLVTHNPIVPLMFGHGLNIFAVEHGLDIKKLGWNLMVPFVVMLWLPQLAWELARKIRSPGEETAYVTYSRLFGYMGATVLAGVLQSVSFTIGLYFWSKFSLSWVYPGILAFGLGLSLLGGLRFVVRPNPRTAVLKRYAGAFLICVETAQLVEFGRLVASMKN
jgi:4-hydroxybenzoate polyprenyltransferase